MCGKRIYKHEMSRFIVNLSKVFTRYTTILSVLNRKMPTPSFRLINAAFSQPFCPQCPLRVAISLRAD